MNGVSDEKINLINELKDTIYKMENIINELKTNDFSRIGAYGDVWTGDAALISKETFEDYYAKFNDLKELIEEYVKNNCSEDGVNE